MIYCIINIISENVEHRISIIELSSSLTYTIDLIQAEILCNKIVLGKKKEEECFHAEKIDIQVFCQINISFKRLS